MDKGTIILENKQIEFKSDAASMQLLKRTGVKVDGRSS